MVVLGLLVTTLGVIGMVRMTDVYTEAHAAAKAVVYGVVAFLAASLAAGEGAITARAVLVAAFLVLTTPVGAHAIARAAYLRGEAMRTPGAVDESERGLQGPPSDPQGSTAARPARERGG